MLRSGWLRMLRRSEPIDSLPELAAPQDDGEDGRVTAAVLALPGKYREVIVLYYYEEMKLQEIADSLRLPVNTVSTRLRRGRAQLLHMLEGGKQP